MAPAPILGQPAPRRIETMESTKQGTPTVGKDDGPSVTELLAKLAAAEAKIANMASAKVQSLTIKRSEKGAVSVYGLGRFPVTLYRSQWERLSASMPAVMAFCKANELTLASKA
jgi:hypothetical protein